MYKSLDHFLARAQATLDPIEGEEQLPEVGDYEQFEETPKDLRPAAVLIPIIQRAAGPTVLFTQRPETMAAHPGQVAFPGGTIDARDANPVAAALREAEEEVGIQATDVELIARSAPYVTGSKFRITPVIGVLPKEFAAIPDPTEVAEVFEAPLEYIMTAANHQRKSVFWEGRTRRYIEMPWQGFRIWGVTAGIIRELYKAVYESEH
ncbi:MAG: CoA pyrophosphatase [Pseudomonadota bacterium]